MTRRPPTLRSLSLLAAALLVACTSDDGEGPDGVEDVGVDTEDVADVADIDPLADVADIPDVEEVADLPGVSDVEDIEDVEDLEDVGPDAAVAALVLPPVQEAALGAFKTSPVCARCHSNGPAAEAMRDSAGREVGFWDLWRSTMMANASRDPFWRAVVSAEVATLPGAAGAIEAKCMRCHTPMLSSAAEAGVVGDPVMEDLTAGDDPAHIGHDGVSCTLCHQIEPDGFGEPESYSGGWVVAGSFVAYGPFPEPFAPSMVGGSGYTPVEQAHMKESALCATCHTLFTATLTEAGESTGHVLPEQAAYLEWRNSAYSREVDAPGPKAASCQDCHVPTTDEDGLPIATKIARRPDGQDFPHLSDRAPVARHLFVGGNTLLPAILRDNREALRPTVPEEAFDATITAARELLSEQSATLVLSDVSREGDVVGATVRVTNLAGHKLPTGFPSRRAWIRLRVLDSGAEPVAVSGDWDDEGRILTADGSVQPFEVAGGPYEPHRSLVTSPDEVAIYESVMARPDGTPTWRVLLGATYVKDNRLLPDGWSSDHPDAADTAPAGVDGDEDFVAGQDDVRYELPVPAGSEAATVEAMLVYQPLASRFAAELFLVDTVPVAQFALLLESADRTPEPVAEATAAVPW